MKARVVSVWLFLVFWSASTGQTLNCDDADCLASQSIKNTEIFLETDDLESARKALTDAIHYNREAKNEINSYLITSLQSELFYYYGLYQFGKHESEKGIEQARQLNDSLLLADAYFFRGINLFELGHIRPAAMSLHQANKFYPKVRKDRIRTIISQSHIYNNLAQTMFALGLKDSAIWYNRLAYKLAIKNRNGRVIANAEQFFGQIYLAEKSSDSSKYYFRKSIGTALNHKQNDVALLSTSFLMKSLMPDKNEIDLVFSDGLNLMKARAINMAYRRLFYGMASDVYKSLGSESKTIELQSKLIEINDTINRHESDYIQDITENYMQSENSLLQSRINQLDQDRNIIILQLVAALLCVAISIFLVIIFRRKNRLQQRLIEQKTEISNDLHDDIGSELSSILIHTDILLANFESDPQQKAILSKISLTGREISERLHAFIWSLNISNNSVESFCEYVAHYGQKLFSDTDISFDFSSSNTSENRELNGYIRKNLFFCIKEALNNIIKHAAATRAIVRIESDQHHVQVVICDNGTNASVLNQFGNGMKNMQRRISNMKGVMSVGRNHGYEIKFKIMLRQK